MSELNDGLRRDRLAPEMVPVTPDLPAQRTSADTQPRSLTQQPDRGRREHVDGAPAIGPAQEPADRQRDIAQEPEDGTAPTGPGGPEATTDDSTRIERPDNPAQPAEVARFDRNDLRPSGRSDPTYGEQLYVGPDGKEHFDGDPIDTRRNIRGQLTYPDGKYAPDSNPRPTDSLQERAQHDLSSRRDHEPQPGASKADERVVKAVSDRDECVQRRDAAWTKVEAIADKLSTNGMTVDKSSTRLDNQELVAKAQPYLTAAERMQLPGRLRELAQLNQAIKDSSERLGTAGGTLASHREFPNAVTVTGGMVEKGTPGNFDRVIMIHEKKQAVIILEEKGVGSGLGSRLAPDTKTSSGPHIRAEQGSTSYLRHLLQTDTKLAAALDRNPALRQRMQAIVNGGGQVRYILARTNSKGIVTVTDFKIDAPRLRRSTIKLPTRRTGA